MANTVDPRRLLAVENALASGAPRAYVIDELTQKWACSRRTAMRAIREVERQWAERAQAGVEDMRTRLTESAWGRFRSAVVKGHDRSAMQALDFIARINGLAAQQVLGVVGPYDSRGVFTSGQAIQDRLRELRAQQAAALAAGEPEDDKDKGGGSN